MAAVTVELWFPVCHNYRRLAPRPGGGGGVVQRGLHALLALGVEGGGGLVQ